MDSDGVVAIPRLYVQLHDRCRFAKSVFESAVSPSAGKATKRCQLSRRKFSEIMVTHEAATVVLEACGTGHYWGRKLMETGHRVVLLPPSQIRGYVPTNETDGADTKALLEAVHNEDIHAVPVKSIDQQTITAPHRIRSA